MDRRIGYAMLLLSRLLLVLPCKSLRVFDMQPMSLRIAHDTAIHCTPCSLSRAVSLSLALSFDTMYSPSPSYL
jgi:hypothetical protein